MANGAPDSYAKSWWKRLTGSGPKDIYLPPEGPRDPRLGSPIPKIKEGIKGFKSMQENLGKAATQKQNDAKGNQYRKSQKDAIMKGLMDGY